MCVLADNPGPMTLDGTNTWLLREPGSAEVVVVDPGPLQHAHLARVREAARADGGRIVLIVLTHHHLDHTEAAGALSASTGAPVRGGGRGSPLRDGERLAHGGPDIDVLATPGHTADSIALLLPADRLLLTGDTVLGRGPTVIVWPDGDLRAYLHTLDRLRALATSGEVTRLAPGHGPVVSDPLAALTELLQHRLARLDQVRAALDGGADTVDAVVAEVYGSVSELLRPAARSSAQAQIAYLTGITTD